jgi:4-diphosphocytidyl-2-C-methyl-D-erythritol kinase
MCPAKINLFLHLVHQRPDGYHTLQTAFVLLNWGDQLKVEITGSANSNLNSLESSFDHIKINTLSGVGREENLIFKAIQAFAQEVQQPLPALNIEVIKSIPMGAGLGGGSSNAAGMLLALNQLMSNPLDIDTLARIGLSLGADVPVFIRQSHAWAEGIGEELHQSNIEPMHFLLAFPPVGVNTAKAFQSPTLKRNNAPLTPVNRMTLDGVQHNHFEPVVRALFPEIDSCFKQLSKHGNPRLSGTGACVFLPFLELAQAENALFALSKEAPTFKLQLASSIDEANAA